MSVHGSHFGAKGETNRTGEERNCAQGTGTEGKKTVNVFWTATDRQLSSRSKDGTFSRQTPEPE
jgi:pullulanase/glycogen debranching enzyme